MLIVSKFHDYYDVGMRNGVDKTVVYKRDTVEVLKKFPLIPVRYTSDNWGWEHAVLGFCGKFYPFIFKWKGAVVTKIVWDVEEAVKLVRPKDEYRWGEFSLNTESGIRNFFANKNYPKEETAFREYNTPIIVFQPYFSSGRWSTPKKDKYDADCLVVNPNLKKIGFYKVMGHIEAFQKIYMFLSGVLGTPVDNMIKVSDKTKASKRGMDGKYSFRKPPGKRGNPKWR